VVLIEVPEMVPELVTVKFPPPVVMREPLRLKLTPTRVIPAAPLVLRLPTRFMVPVEVAFSDVAAKFWTVMSWALTTTVVPRGVVLPAFPDKVTFPPPAVIVKLPGPSNVLEKVTG